VQVPGRAFGHKLICALGGALGLVAAAAAAAAQGWAARPAKFIGAPGAGAARRCAGRQGAPRPTDFIVPQAAGGTPDIICRLITEKLSRVLGQQVVVENRPGAGNVIGAQAAARAAPDGYTFFFATAAALVTNPYTFKSVPYDPGRDFVPG